MTEPKSMFKFAIRLLGLETIPSESEFDDEYIIELLERRELVPFPRILVLAAILAVYLTAGTLVFIDIPTDSTFLDWEVLIKGAVATGGLAVSYLSYRFGRIVSSDKRQIELAHEAATVDLLDLAGRPEGLDFSRLKKWARFRARKASGQFVKFRGAEKARLYHEELDGALAELVATGQVRRIGSVYRVTPASKLRAPQARPRQR